MASTRHVSRSTIATQPHQESHEALSQTQKSVLRVILVAIPGEDLVGAALAKLAADSRIQHGPMMAKGCVPCERNLACGHEVTVVCSQNCSQAYG